MHMDKCICRARQLPKFDARAKVMVAMMPNVKQCYWCPYRYQY